VVGGILGAVWGSVSGVAVGKKKSKARKYQRMAAEVQKEREKNSQYTQYLEQVKSARRARATSLQAAINSGVSSSSLTQAATAMTGSNFAYAYQYTSEDFRLQALYNAFMRRAQKNLNTANKLQTGKSLTDTAVGLAAAGYNMATSGAAAAGAEAGKEVAKEAGTTVANTTTTTAGTTTTTQATTAASNSGFWESFQSFAKENPMEAFQLGQAGAGLFSSIGSLFDTSADDMIELQYPDWYK
jgi:hypothetical protein